MAERARSSRDDTNWRVLVKYGWSSLLVVVLAVLAGCSSMKATSSYSTNEDFSTFRTWNWLPAPPSTPVPTDSTITDPKVLARIADAIENQLVAQGYHRTDHDPDFFVKFHAAFKTNLTQTMVDDRYDNSSYAGYTQDFQYDYTHVYHQGSLIIDVLDAQSVKIVWRGYASAEINPDDPLQKRQKRVKEAVAKILKAFPPKKK